jgi:hypothetical protein
MKEFFGYIYYRINKAYFKWDGRAGFTSILGVSMIQFMWLFVLIVFVSKFYFLPGELEPYVKGIKYAALACLGVIILLNYITYNGKYNYYRSQWREEDRRQRITRGILIVLLMALPWILFPIIVNSRF